ncbi:MAG: hypothetical protein ACPHXW_01685 [Marinobacterium sp.]
MKLFRDFIDGRICFYWATDIGMQLSPRLATLQDAEEWWKTFLFTTHRGDERRCSIHDRRSDFDKRRRFSRNGRSGLGRRRSDMPVRVQCDLAGDKIEAWKVLVRHELRGQH